MECLEVLPIKMVKFKYIYIMKNKFFLLFVLFFCLTTTYSQNIDNESNNGAFSVSGRIIEETNHQAVEYVIVKLYNSKDSTFIKSDVTDNSGEFNIVVQSSGKYYLTFSLIGYEPKTVSNIKVNLENSNVNLGDVIIKSSVINLNEVNLIGSYRLKIDVDKKYIILGIMY